MKLRLPKTLLVAFALCIAPLAIVKASLNQEKAGSLSFLIVAKHSHFMFVANKQYTLTIPRKDIKSVLAVSDQPYRHANTLDPNTFSQLIHSGKNNFDKNPPNIAIYFHNAAGDTAAFSVSRYKLDKKNITYSLTLLLNDKAGVPNQSSGPIAFLIDDIPGMAGINSIINNEKSN